MVHALEEAHRLLTPDGLLVDIHPLPEAPTIEVRQGGKLLLSETYPSQSVEDYRQADRAIESAIERPCSPRRTATSSSSSPTPLLRPT